MLDIEVYGNVEEAVLRESVEMLLERLIQADGITQVDLDDVRDFEVHVELPQENLRRYGLTMQDVVSKLRASSLEVPGGKIETDGGELLHRVDERRDYAMQFARIPIIVTPEGATFYLEDIGIVRETFEGTNDATFYNDAPSVGMDVYHVGKETPIGVSDAAKQALQGVEAELPPGVDYVIRRDDSDRYRDRRDLLLKNMGVGLLVLLLILSLFLEFKLAFWVMMGVPISFIGALLFLPLLGVSINMISMFAFIIALRLDSYSVLKGIDDGYAPGKRQFDFSVTPAGESLGINAQWLATLLRNSYQGSEAIKQQRGRNELTVRVRLPESERTSTYDLETLIIRTPSGGEVPLMEVATVEPGRAYTTINRRDGRRTSNVTADISPIGESGRTKAEVQNNLLPQLMQDFPDLSAGFEGRQAEFAESFESLKSNILIALILIYVLLAIPLRSYPQPLIVMLAIPFGLVGAVLGHAIMGFNLSIISVMGIIALSGMVVNDSLVLIGFCNNLVRKQGIEPREAIYLAGIRRFRPILLTTITTFGGLAPMIFETSRLARFMIPMAISLGFGILFSPLIVVIIVPCTYMVMEDIRRFFTFPSEDTAAPATADATEPAAA